MKNLKKVLALAVAFVMCFTMFAGAAVYSDVPAGSDYSEAVTLLSDLGIIAGLPDGSFGVNQTITRADAACLIARMMTGETMPSKYAGASNFTDVPKDAYYESAVAYCAIMGITSGTSATLGTYSPSREITDGEFIAMITRALGYDSAENPLSFPMGNIARAQQEGILDNVNVVADSPALRGEDAMMIYNALFADFDSYAKQQNIYMGADDQVRYTIAHEVFELDRLAWVEAPKRDYDGTGYALMYRDEINTGTYSGEHCAAHTWVVAGVDPRQAANTYTAFPIDDKGNVIFADGDDMEAFAISFVYEGDPSAVLGYQVELWGDLSHNGQSEVIKAVKTVKGQTSYNWNPGLEEDGAKKLTTAEGTVVNAKESPVSIPQLQTKDGDDDDILVDINMIEPDRKDKHVVSAYRLIDFDSDENDYDFRDGDSYELFDWDSDGDIDFAIKTTRKYAEIIDIDKDDITIKGIVDDKDQEISLEIDADRLKFNCDGLEEGDVVEMTVSRAYDKGEDAEVTTINMKEITSQIEELTRVSTKGELQLTFGGEVRQLAEGSDKWDLVEDDDNDLTESDLEGNYEIWLDANGFIVKLEESDNNTGYLVALDLEDGYNKLTKSRSDRAVMKAILDDNTVDSFEVAFDLDIVGTKYVGKDGTTYDASEVVTTPGSNIGKLQRGANPATEIVSVLTRQNITSNFYNSKTYGWEDASNNDSTRAVVGQVYKYWMDSDKVITKLERVAETQGIQTQYWENTGVIQVDQYNGSVNSLTTYQNRNNFNGNVYLKRSNALFITDRDFIYYDSDISRWIGDEDKIMALEPTTSNLSKIDRALVDPSNSDWFTRHSTSVNEIDEGSLYVENPDTPGSYTVHKNIAYDLDKDNYATTAIMTISNFDDFDSQIKVAMITDVDAYQRKNTIFEVEGAIDGKVDTFISVEEDDGVDGMFFKYDPERKDSRLINNPLSKDGLVAYNTLNEIRDDIDDKAVYGEVTMNSEGKVTKVVIMTADAFGNIVGPNKIVLRLVAGEKMEVTKTGGYASFFANNNGDNVAYYADVKDLDSLYMVGSVSWGWNFDVNSSTNVYTIGGSMKDVMPGKNRVNQQLVLATDGVGDSAIGSLPYFAKEDLKIAVGVATDITASNNKNNSTNSDKYAVMDVAFNRDKIVKDKFATNAAGLTYLTYSDTWSTDNSMAASVKGVAANAVFSYEKRFGTVLIDENETLILLDNKTPIATGSGATSKITVNAPSYAKAALYYKNGGDLGTAVQIKDTNAWQATGLAAGKYTWKVLDSNNKVLAEVDFEVVLPSAQRMTAERVKSSEESLMALNKTINGQLSFSDPMEFELKVNNSVDTTISGTSNVTIDGTAYAGDGTDKLTISVSGGVVSIKSNSNTAVGTYDVAITANSQTVTMEVPVVSPVDYIYALVGYKDATDEWSKNVTIAFHIEGEQGGYWVTNKSDAQLVGISRNDFSVAINDEPVDILGTDIVDAPVTNWVAGAAAYKLVMTNDANGNKVFSSNDKITVTYGDMTAEFTIIADPVADILGGSAESK